MLSKMADSINTAMLQRGRFTCDIQYSVRILPPVHKPRRRWMPAFSLARPPPFWFFDQRSAEVIQLRKKAGKY